MMTLNKNVNVSEEEATKPLWIQVFDKNLKFFCSANESDYILRYYDLKYPHSTIIVFSFYAYVLKNARSIVECGSNIGLHTIVMATILNNYTNDWKIVAYDIADPAISLFKRNIQINNDNQLPLKNIKFIKQALSNKAAEFEFEQSNKLGTSQLVDYQVQKRVQRRGKPIYTKKVKTASLDQLHQDQIVDFVKIDVESQDCKIIQGSENLIKKNKERIVFLFEYWGQAKFLRGTYSQDCIQILDYFIRKYDLSLYGIYGIKKTKRYHKLFPQ